MSPLGVRVEPALDAQEAHDAAHYRTRVGHSAADHARKEGTSWTGRLAAVSVVAAILPVAVAVGRAVASDWMAIGDNALFAIRARDVFSEHHPFLGLWSSASLTIGQDVNHPGPLLFDALALPVRLGGDAGLAVGVALINTAAIVGMALVARRQAGGRGVVVAMMAAAGLGWTTGSELLFDPWQPHSLLFPVLLFLLLVWALVNGDVALLPWAVAVGSFVAQTHIGYVLLVPALGAVGAGAVGVRLWRAWRVQGDDWPARRRRAQRSLGIAAVVGLAAWSQPLYEQLFRDGNLSRMASGAGDTGETLGLGTAPRFVADVVALPPWWGRPSISETLAADSVRPSLATSLLALLVVFGLLVSAGLLARRRGGGAGPSAAATGVIVLVVALLAAAALPITQFGRYGVADHQVRWLWPMGLFLTFTLTLVLVTAQRARFAGIGLVAATLVTVTLGALALPTMNPGVGPSRDVDAIPAVRSLVRQLEPLRDERGVLFDLEGQRFAEPYTMPVMSALQRLDVPFFVDDAGMARQLGPKRAWHPGAEASVRLSMRERDAARDIPEGARRIAFFDGQSAGTFPEYGRITVALFTEPLDQR